MCKHKSQISFTNCDWINTIHTVTRAYESRSCVWFASLEFSLEVRKWVLILFLIKETILILNLNHLSYVIRGSKILANKNLNHKWFHHKKKSRIPFLTKTKPRSWNRVKRREEWEERRRGLGLCFNRVKFRFSLVINDLVNWNRQNPNMWVNRSRNINSERF